jgi:hypothetical protein
VIVPAALVCLIALNSVASHHAAGPLEGDVRDDAAAVNGARVGTHESRLAPGGGIAILEGLSIPYRRHPTEP